MNQLITKVYVEQPLATPGLLIMTNILYEYEILAFDRQVAGSSPTVGVWNPYQRKGVLQRVLQREFGKLLLPSYLGVTCMETTTLCNTRCITLLL